MKKIACISFLTVLGLCSTAATAVDKVVVIPMGGTKTVTVSNFSGVWSPDTTYQAGQTVQIDGSTYVCLTTHTSASTPNMSYWGLMAAKGDQGIPGPIGPKGDPGQQGDPGNDGISCWDLNENRVCDLSTEDADSDGVCDVHDCQAPNFFPVYDNLDVFVGYFLGEYVAAGGVGIVASTNGYNSRFTRSGYYSWMQQHYYTEAGCTGTPYARGDNAGLSFLEKNTDYRGQVFLIGPLLYYIPQNANSIQISNFYILDLAGCDGPHGGPFDVYPAVPNDPAVTGFQNTYNWPIKTVYRIPPAP